MGRLVFLLMIIAANVALADEVTLTSGGKLSGIARADGDSIVVETGYGKMTFSKDMVVSIDKSKRSKLEEFRSMELTVSGTATAQQLYDMAKWAKDNDLPKYHREYLQKVLSVDADHEFARRELGYHLFNNKWMTYTEVMLAKGFIQFEGRWVTPSERELIVKERADEHRKRDDERRKREEERKKAYEEALARYKAQLEQIRALQTAPRYTARYSPYYFSNAYPVPLIGTFDVTKINPFSFNPLGLPWMDPYKKQ